MVLSAGLQVSEHQLMKFIEETRAKQPEEKQPLSMAALRRFSGLGHVNSDVLRKVDLLPSRAKVRNDKDCLIRIYVSEMRGDLLSLYVPMSLLVVPPKWSQSRFTDIWGEQALEDASEPPSLAQMIEEVLGVPMCDQRLVYGAERLTMPGRSLASYGVSHGQTLYLYDGRRSLGGQSVDSAQPSLHASSLRL